MSVCPKQTCVEAAKIESQRQRNRSAIVTVEATKETQVVEERQVGLVGAWDDGSIPEDDRSMGWPESKLQQVGVGRLDGVVRFGPQAYGRK